MPRIERLAQSISVVVRGRKLKGKELGRYTTLDQELCRKLDIAPGDILEMKLVRVRKPDIVTSQEQAQVQ
jgi:hypothetical protein